MRRVLAGTVWTEVDEETRFYRFRGEAFGVVLNESFHSLQGALSKMKERFEPMLRENIADEYVVQYKHNNGSSSFIIMTLGKPSPIRKNFIQVIKNNPLLRDSFGEPQGVIINNVFYSLIELEHKVDAPKKARVEIVLADGSRMDLVYTEKIRDLMQYQAETATVMEIMRDAKHNVENKTDFVDQLVHDNLTKTSVIQKKQKVVRSYEVSEFDYMKYTPWEYDRFERRSVLNPREYTYSSVLRKASTVNRRVARAWFFAGLVSNALLIAFLILNNMLINSGDPIIEAQESLKPTHDMVLRVSGILIFVFGGTPSLMVMVYRRVSMWRVSNAYDKAQEMLGIRWRLLYKRKLYKIFIPALILQMFAIITNFFFITFYVDSAYFELRTLMPLANIIVWLQFASVLFLGVEITFYVRVVAEMLHSRRKTLEKHFSRNEWFGFRKWYNSFEPIPYIKKDRQFYVLDMEDGYKYISHQLKKINDHTHDENEVIKHKNLAMVHTLSHSAHVHSHDIYQTMHKWDNVSMISSKLDFSKFNKNNMDDTGRTVISRRYKIEQRKRAVVKGGSKIELVVPKKTKANKASIIAKRKVIREKEKSLYEKEAGDLDKKKTSKKK